MAKRRDEIGGYPKRLAAAEGRRDRGDRPMIWDNEVLGAEGRRGNRLAAVRPTMPRMDSKQGRVLRTFRPLGRGGAAVEIARACGLSEREVRAAIDGLRGAKGWPIENDGDGHFHLDLRDSLAKAAWEEFGSDANRG